MEKVKKVKLIRDHIPGMSDDAWIEVDKKEAYEWLKGKLHEETQELTDSGYKDIQEFVDVLEVLMELAKRAKIDWNQVDVARRIKKKERGGFTNKILISS